MTTTDPHGETRAETRAGTDSGTPQKLDREINLRGLTIFTVVLALIMAVAVALMWGLSDYLTTSLEARDPAPPVLPAARQQWEPPEPRLQTSPEEDMRRMRDEEATLLGSYGWVDEGAGVARVPIDRALELVAEHGLPEAAASAVSPAATPAEGAEESAEQSAPAADQAGPTTTAEGPSGR